MIPRSSDGTKEVIRVMIVENHQTILWGLHNIINAQQPLMNVVAIASSDQEATKSLIDMAPQVVVLKYQLARPADEQGLLRLCINRGCRVLLFTENFDEDMLQMTLRSGAHGLLTGNSTAQEIIKAIEKTYRGELWFGREVTRLVLNAFRAPVPKQKSMEPDELLSELTPRERKVVQAVVENKVRSNKGLAKQLFISESTLRNHLSSIYQKLGVGNRLDLYVFVHDHGLKFAGKHHYDQHSLDFRQFAAA